MRCDFSAAHVAGVWQLVDSSPDMRSSDPVSKVCFIRVCTSSITALGQHQFVSRVQGGKLKRKNEIRVSAIFKTLPEPLLRMVAVHELAHLREKENSVSQSSACPYSL